MSSVDFATTIAVGSVLAVVFETTGDISVLHRSGDETVELEGGLLEDVRCGTGGTS